MEDIDNLEDLEGPKFARKLRGLSRSGISSSSNAATLSSPTRMPSNLRHSDTPRSSTFSPNDDDNSRTSGRTRKRPRGFSPSPEVDFFRSRRSWSTSTATTRETSVDSDKSGLRTIQIGFAVPDLPATRKRIKPTRRFSPTPSSPTPLFSSTHPPVLATPLKIKSENSEWINFADFTRRLVGWPNDDFELPRTFYEKIPQRVQAQMTAAEYWNATPEDQQSTCSTSWNDLSTITTTPSNKPVKKECKNFKTNVPRDKIMKTESSDSSDEEVETKVVRRSAMGAAPFSTNPTEHMVSRSFHRSSLLSANKRQHTIPAEGGKEIVKFAHMRSTSMKAHPLSSDSPVLAVEMSLDHADSATSRRGRRKASTPDTVTVDSPISPKVKRSPRRKSGTIAESCATKEPVLVSSEVPVKRGRGRPPINKSKPQRALSSSTVTNYTRHPSISAEEVKKRVQTRSQSPTHAPSVEKSVSQSSSDVTSITVKSSRIHKGSFKKKESFISNRSPPYQETLGTKHQTQEEKMRNLSFTAVDSIPIAPQTPPNLRFADNEESRTRSTDSEKSMLDGSDIVGTNKFIYESEVVDGVQNEAIDDLQEVTSNSSMEKLCENEGHKSEFETSECTGKRESVKSREKKKRRMKNKRGRKKFSLKKISTIIDAEASDHVLKPDVSNVVSGKIETESVPTVDESEEKHIDEEANTSVSEILDVRRSGRRSVPSIKLRSISSIVQAPSPTLKEQEKEKPLRSATDPNSALGIIQRAGKFRRRRSPTPELSAIVSHLLQKNLENLHSSSPVKETNHGIKSEESSEITTNNKETNSKCMSIETVQLKKVEKELQDGSQEEVKTHLSEDFHILKKNEHSVVVGNTDDNGTEEAHSAICYDQIFDSSDWKLCNKEGVANMPLKRGKSSKISTLTVMEKDDLDGLSVVDFKDSTKSGAGRKAGGREASSELQNTSTRAVSEIERKVESGRSRRSIQLPSRFQDFETGRLASSPIVTRGNVSKTASKKNLKIKTLEVFGKDEVSQLGPPTVSMINNKTGETRSSAQVAMDEEFLGDTALTPRITLKISLSKQQSCVADEAVESSADIIKSDVTEESAQNNMNKPIFMQSKSKKRRDDPRDSSGLPDYVPSEKPILGSMIMADGSTENLGRSVSLLMDRLLMDVCQDGIKHSAWRVSKKMRDKRQQERAAAKYQELKEARLRNEIEKEKRPFAALQSPIGTVGIGATRERRGNRMKLIPELEPRMTRGRVEKESYSMEIKTMSPSPLHEGLQDLVKFYSDKNGSKPSSPLGSPAGSGRRRRQSAVLVPPAPPSEATREPTPEIVDRKKMECTYSELVRNCGWEGDQMFSNGIARVKQKHGDELFYREMLTENPVGPSFSDVDVTDIDIDGMDDAIILKNFCIDPPPERALDSERSRDIASRIVNKLPRPLKEEGEWGIDDVTDRIETCISEDMVLGPEVTVAEINRMGMVRRDLFQRILEIVMSQYVSDETCAMRTKNGNSVHYVIAQKNAQKFRDAMRTFSVLHEYAAYWVHRQLVTLLPIHFLASYILVLRHGKKLNNSNVSILNRALKLPKDCEESEEEVEKWKEVSEIMIHGCRSKLGDPNSDEIGRTTLSRVLSDVVTVCVNPNFRSEFIDQKVKYHDYVYKMLRSVCNASSLHVQLELEDDRVTIPEAVDIAVSQVLSVVRKCLKDHRNKRVVLVGWGTSTYINHRVVNLLPGISALIDFAFPCVTALGPRGSADDDISLTYCPVLFMVGERATDYHPRTMKNLRDGMLQHSGLVIVGGANENLCVDSEILCRERITQRVVIRGIVEQIIDFLQLSEIRMDRSELVPLELNGAFNVDIALMKGPPRVAASKNREDERPQSTAPLVSEGIPAILSHEDKDKAPKQSKPRKRKVDRDAPPSSYNPSDFNPYPIGHGGMSTKELARQRFSSALFASPFQMKSSSPLASPIGSGPTPKRRPTTPLTPLPLPTPQAAPASSLSMTEVVDGPIDPASISLG